MTEATPAQALAAASGHTEEDADLILSELRRAGWILIRPTWSTDPTRHAAPSREPPKGYSVS